MGISEQGMAKEEGADSGSAAAGLETNANRWKRKT